MIHFFQELKLKDLHGSMGFFVVSNIRTDPTQDLAAEVLRYFLVARRSLSTSHLRLKHRGALYLT